MTDMIFVNIATDNLERAKTFYTGLGCSINPLFTDEQAACIVWSEHIYFMVLRRERFADFTDKPIANAKETTQVLIAFSRDSRDEVDRIFNAGIAAGGTESRPTDDLGFMYTRYLSDPDGNMLEFFYMDPVASAQGPEAYMEGQG
jgi:predicted lactoylglutathione lyase